MPRMIQAKIVNGTLVPLEPLGIEEGANVAFELVAKAPPGVAPNMRDYLGYAKTKTPSEINEELFIEGYLAKERRIRESESGEFPAIPDNGEFPAEGDSKKPKHMLNDEEDARHRRPRDRGMIVPDINMLVYAYNPATPEHAAARRWWQGLLDESESIGIPWLVTTGFIRVISNPRTMALPLSPVDALDHVQDWLNHNHVMIITPGDRHLDYFRRNLAVAYSGPDMIADAHIAALAMEYDAEVHTRDMGFGKFPNLLWRNPLRDP